MSGSGSGSGSGGRAAPNRRVVVGSLLGALVGGSLLGLVIGVIAPPGTTAVTVSAVGASGTPTATSSGPTPTASSASPSPSVKKTLTTVTATPSAVPPDFIQSPAQDRTMVLGTLEGVESRGNGTVITIKRGKLLTGDAAQQYWASQNEQPRDTAVVAVAGAQPQRFLLRDDAAIWGVYSLGDHQTPQLHRLDVGGFVDAANTALANNDHPGVWLKRSLGIVGPVIYLAEQY